ncbi:hypothetical protein VTO42DRAFT_4335 [Malbranchea cinnamomea]
MDQPATKRRKLSSTAEDQPTSNGNHRQTPASTSSHRNARSATASSAAELAVASGQFKSNVFKFQIDELLSQLRPDHEKQLSRVQGPLRRLKEIIESIPDSPAKPLWEAAKELRKRSEVEVPFPDPLPSKDTKYTVAYAKPANINVVGSFALKTGAKTPDANLLIDLAVTIPDSLFQRKDHLKYRYFYKRAYYVACIAEGIQRAEDPAFDISYGYQDGNSLRPIILVKPGKGADEAFVRSKACIRIITAIGPETFQLSHTFPTSNNLRQSKDSTDDAADSSMADTKEPTPVYNGSLRSEACVALYLKALHSAGVKCPAFRDACILGRTWLRQRGFGSSLSAGGFGPFEWTVLIAVLLETGGPNGKPLLSPSYSGYQIFKATIQFLASKDLTSPLMLFPSAGPQPSIPSSRSPVLYDGKRGINVLYKMSPWSYALLRYECRLTLVALNDSLHDHFYQVFINKVCEPLCRYDQVVHLNPRTPRLPTLDRLQYLSTLYRVISRALADRAKLVTLSYSDPVPWSVKSRVPPVETKDALITVGLLLDADHTTRVIDHGPAAEEKEAAASFREFWGDKAELRRFKDGSIFESLVWSDQPSDGPILQQILTYILKKHLDLQPDDIVLLGTGSLSLIHNSRDAVATFKHVIDSYDSFEKELQNLEGLPLEFHQLSPSSPLLRYSSTRIPSASRSTAPADVVLQFESSTRWPDDLVAIQMTKLAFLVKIGELLEDSKIATSCRVGLENTSSKIVNNAFLDIAYSPLVSFRLRIYHDRERTLLERRLKDRNLGPKAKSEAADALAAHKRIFTQSIRHTQAVRMLCTRYPLLSPTIRAFKAWASSHLFTPHLSEELLELFVCHVFLYPYPWGIPASVLTGLLRTLDLLARWDWTHEPLILDFNSELSADALADIKNRFDAWRKLDPAMNIVSFFVASNLDPDGVTWTQFARPPKVVAARVTQLAKAAMKLVKEQGTALDVSSLFRSPLSDYDFVLHLNTEYTQRDSAKEKSVFKNIREATQDAGGGMTGYKSVLAFVGELNRLFGQNILFFHGDDRTKVVAGIWNPQSVKPKSFALKRGYSTCPVKATSAPDGDSEGEITLNKTAILNEIATLGGDLVEKIEVNR